MSPSTGEYGRKKERDGVSSHTRGKLQRDVNVTCSGRC